MNKKYCQTHTKEEISVKPLMDIILETEYEIIVFNDDVNTFEHVIESLVAICAHSYAQAEQCTHIIHHSGQCGVKTGQLKKLKPMCGQLLDRGISAKIV